MKTAARACVVLIMLLAAAAAPIRAQSSIVGVWQRVIVDAKGQTEPDPAPMLLVYTDVGIYVQVSFRLDRQDSRPLADLNADELRARFNGTSAQHGTYSVDGNRLTRRIVGSFTPINQGKEQVTYFKIDRDTLVMGDENVGKVDVATARIQFRRVKQTD